MKYYKLSSMAGAEAFVSRMRGSSIVFRVFWLLCALLLVPAQSARSADSRPLDLTTEERSYLESHPVLRLGVGTAFPPFMFADKDSAFKGIVSDYLALLETRLGVRMEPVLDIPFTEALARGKRGEIDVFPAIADTPERREFLVYTRPYISYPLVIVTRGDAPFIGSVEDLSGKTVAVVKHLANYSKYVNDLPDVQMTFHFEKDVASVLSAVSIGDADACVANLAVASYFISSLGLSNLRIAAPTPWGRNDLAMAVPKDRPVLASILQKALNSVTFEESDAIRQRWINLHTAPLADPVFVRQIAIQAAITVAIVFGIILLWNRRLRREIREREKAEAMRVDVERMIRHELRSPLSSFISMCQILETSGRLPDDLRETVDLGHREAERMLGIIALQMDLFRMEMGTYEADFVAVDMNVVVHAVLVEQEKLRRSLNIAIDVRNEGETPMVVMGEEHLLRIVVSNILKNAVEASPAGGAVNVTLRHIGDAAEIVVHNDGTVPKAVRKRFFDKYATADKKSGTGLGTYTARLFTEVLGGTVRMETAADTGTRVTVTLVSSREP